MNDLTIQLPRKGASRRRIRDSVRSNAGLLLVLFLCVFPHPGKSQTLQTYLDAAESNNPAVRENANLSAIADLEVDKAKAIYRTPEVNATANLLVSPIVKGIGYDINVTNGGWYSAQMNFNLPLFTGPQIHTQIENSEAGKAIYAQNTAVSRHDLARQVTEQYILTWQNMERINNTQKLLDLLDEQEKLVRTFAKTGILAESDVLFFTIEKENQGIILLDFQQAYRQGLASLNLLCGMVDTARVELSRPDISIVTDDPGTSRFLEIYALQSRLAQSNQEISELKYRPQVSAFANYGLNAVVLKDIYQKFGASAGINFSFVIFDGKQRSITRQQTSLLRQSNESNRAWQARQTDQQRLIARQQIDLLDRKTEVLQQQIASYETLLKFYRERIAKGELSVNDYMNVVRSFATAQSDLVSLSTSRLLLVNNYNYWNW